MKVLNVNQEYTRPIVLSLGFFDCIHIGHKSLIASANKLAKSIGAESFVFTFSSDPSLYFKKSKQIFTFEDRLKVLENLHVDGVISSEFDENFANISPKSFLDMIFKRFNVKAVVVGADYTFGCRAEGNVEVLKGYATVKGARVLVVPFECAHGEKLSTKNLKSYVESGDVKELNDYLAEPYFMTGTVASAKHNGTRMGFPTANIQQSADRLALKEGVYATEIVVDGKKYVSMTNVGAKPTFNDFSSSVETFILDFNGDIYGKTIKLSFFDRLRDVKTFAGMDELKTQLAKDEQTVRALLKR